MHIERNSAAERLDRHYNASIVLRRHNARIPQTAEERKLPLQQYDAVLIYNVAAMLLRANPKTHARFRHLQMMLEQPIAPELAQPIVVPVSRNCTAAHCAIRIQNGIISRVDAAEERLRPSFGFTMAFVVAEIFKQRLRAIDHPIASNDAACAAG